MKKLLEFDDLVWDLADKGFDIVVAEVKKIAPDLDFALVYQAFEAAMEEDEDKAPVEEIDGVYVDKQGTNQDVWFFSFFVVLCFYLLSSLSVLFKVL